MDICSRILKRELARKWVDENCPHVESTILFFGIDHSEQHRTASIARNWAPYHCEFPLCFPPYISTYEMIAEIERDGLDPPQMYDEGFAHNNCKGFCVKGGHSSFLHLLRTRPEVFYENADEEKAFREETGLDVAVMRDRNGGETTPLPMHRFALEVLSGERTVRGDDWGKGCECFITPADGLQACDLSGFD